MDPRTPVTVSRGRERRRGRSFVRDLVVIVVVAAVASLLIKTFLIRSFFIPSPSMESTLLGEPGHHDRILVDELVPRIVPVQRGDVVVFTDPGGWLPPDPSSRTDSGNPVGVVIDEALSLVGLSTHDADDHLVKRVIGLPGDRVACCNALGQMTVNGIPLSEPYAHVPAGYTDVSRDSFHVTVAPHSLWVMGDNRYDSADSRYHQDTPTHGAVPITDVVGRAFVISWPITRWRWLSNYPDTYADLGGH